MEYKEFSTKQGIIKIAEFNGDIKIYSTQTYCYGCLSKWLLLKIGCSLAI